MHNVLAMTHDKYAFRLAIVGAVAVTGAYMYQSRLGTTGGWLSAADNPWLTAPRPGRPSPRATWLRCPNQTGHGFYHAVMECIVPNLPRLYTYANETVTMDSAMAAAVARAVHSHVDSAGIEQLQATSRDAIHAFYDDKALTNASYAALQKIWPQLVSAGRGEVLLLRDGSRRFSTHLAAKLAAALREPIIWTGEEPANTIVPVFSDACIVVGYHGAGLANVALSATPTCVVEISTTYANGSPWRSNCRELTKLPYVRGCQTLFIPSARKTTLSWNSVSRWLGLEDEDHFIKNEGVVQPRVTASIYTAISDMRTICCGDPPATRSA